MNAYNPKFLWWFAVVCGDLWWFGRFLTAHGHTDVLSSQILVVICGGLRWCVVVCGGLWWFVVVCGGLWWFAVDCGGLSFSHTRQMRSVPDRPMRWAATTIEISRIIVRCRSHSSDVFPRYIRRLSYFLF